MLLCAFMVRGRQACISNGCGLYFMLYLHPCTAVCSLKAHQWLLSISSKHVKYSIVLHYVLPLATFSLYFLLRFSTETLYPPPIKNSTTSCELIIKNKNKNLSEQRERSMFEIFVLKRLKMFSDNQNFCGSDCYKKWKFISES